MALSETDIETLSQKLINRFNLIDFPDVENIVKENISIWDLKLEEKFPTVYFNGLSSNVLKEKEFIKAREYYILCNLFTEHSEYLASFNQAQNITEIQNSAGTRMKMSDNKTQELKASDYCQFAQSILITLGVFTKPSKITFTQANNVLVKDNLNY